MIPSRLAGRVVHPLLHDNHLPSSATMNMMRSSSDLAFIDLLQAVTMASPVPSGPACRHQQVRPAFFTNGSRGHRRQGQAPGRGFKPRLATQHTGGDTGRVPVHRRSRIQRLEPEQLQIMIAQKLITAIVVDNRLATRTPEIGHALISWRNASAVEAVSRRCLIVLTSRLDVYARPAENPTDRPQTGRLLISNNDRALFDLSRK